MKRIHSTIGKIISAVLTLVLLAINLPYRAAAKITSHPKGGKRTEVNYN